MCYIGNVADFGNRRFASESFDPAGYAKRLGLPEIEKYLNANRVG